MRKVKISVMGNVELKEERKHVNAYEMAAEVKRKFEEEIIKKLPYGGKLYYMGESRISWFSLYGDQFKTVTERKNYFVKRAQNIPEKEKRPVIEILSGLDKRIAIETGMALTFLSSMVKVGDETISIFRRLERNADKKIEGVIFKYIDLLCDLGEISNEIYYENVPNVPDVYLYSRVKINDLVRQIRIIK